TRARSPGRRLPRCVQFDSFQGLTAPAEAANMPRVRSAERVCVFGLGIRNAPRPRSKGWQMTYPLLRRRLLPALILVSALTLSLGGVTPTGSASPPCTLYASLRGSDSNPGTPAAPFRTAQKLVDSLSAGKTGCLTGGGTFVGDVRFDAGGAA